MRILLLVLLLLSNVAFAQSSSVKIWDGTRTATVRSLGSSPSLNVAVTDASGNQITTFGNDAITTGGFVVELVFAIPGLGRYFVQAVQQLDYTVIMGTTVFYGAFLVFMVIVVDVLYGLIDPRVRMQ